MPLAGANSPVPLAGVVVQHTAESLSGVIFNQLANPGAPIVWGGSSTTIDMRKGTTPMGAIGTWMINCADVHIAKKLNLPTHSYLGMSDAKIVDTQCSLESSNDFLAAIAGANMVSGVRMMDFEICLSCEQLVVWVRDHRHGEALDRRYRWPSEAHRTRNHAGTWSQGKLFESPPHEAMVPQGIVYRF